jgi:hypothetical protein
MLGDGVQQTHWSILLSIASALFIYAFHTPHMDAFAILIVAA